MFHMNEIQTPKCMESVKSVTDKRDKSCLHCLDNRSIKIGSDALKTAWNHAKKMEQLYAAPSFYVYGLLLKKQ